MTNMTDTTTDPADRPSLRRSKNERILFGVCGGIASYFNLDPTLVRVGFVLVGLVPPLGGTLLLAYIAMTLIVPEEGKEPLTGRDQVRENFTSLRTEVTGLAETVRARVTGEPSASAAGAQPSAPVEVVAPAQDVQGVHGGASPEVPEAAEAEAQPLAGAAR